MKNETESKSNSLKRKDVTEPESTSINKKIRSETEIKYIGECHAYFYPVGSIIHLFLQATRYTNGCHAGGVEVFGVEPLFCLMLDYLGRYSTWSVKYQDFDHRGRLEELGVRSTHQSKTEALRAVVIEWFCEHVDQFDEKSTILYDYVQTLRYELNHRDSVEDIINERYDDSLESEDFLLEIWGWIEKWQLEDDNHNRHYELQEIPFAVTPSKKIQVELLEEAAEEDDEGNDRA